MGWGIRALSKPQHQTPKSKTANQKRISLAGTEIGDSNRQNEGKGRNIKRKGTGKASHWEVYLHSDFGVLFFPITTHPITNLVTFSDLLLLIILTASFYLGFMFGFLVYMAAL